MGNEDVAAVVKGCPNITQLDLKDNKNITDEGIEVLARGLRKLSSVNLIGLKLLKERSLKALADCPELKIIWLHKVPVSGAGLRHLVTGKYIGQLTHLVRCCTVCRIIIVLFLSKGLKSNSIEDDVFCQLFRNATSLVDFQIRKTAPSDTAMKILATHNTAIKYFLPTHSQTMTDEGVIALVNARGHYLKGIALLGKVSDKGLGEVLRCCPNIKVVYVDTPEITSPMLKQLGTMQKLKELQIWSTCTGML
jgi:hypothetical protein